MEKLRNKNQTATVSNEKRFMEISKGIALGCLFTIVTFVITALVLTYSDVSESIISTVSIVSTVISALISGFFTGKSVSEKGLVWGMISGFLMFTIIFLILSLNKENMEISVGATTGLICAIAGGGIGGILGVNCKK